MFIEAHENIATMLERKHSRFKASTPMKVLLVEDSILIRNMLIEIVNRASDLTVNGIAVTQNCAINSLDEQQFDMLLVDIELAEGNGFEFVRHTQKETYSFKPPLFVMLTNHTNPHYRRIAKELGVHYFFDKLMDFDLAIETIELEARKFANNVH